MRFPARAIASTVLALGGAGVAANAQQLAYPIEAKLVSSFDARALQAGQEVLLTSIRKWQDGDCHLAEGATLHGIVVSVATGRGVSGRTSRLHLPILARKLERFRFTGLPSSLPTRT